MTSFIQVRWRRFPGAWLRPFSGSLVLSLAGCSLLAFSPARAAIPTAVGVLYEYSDSFLANSLEPGELGRNTPWATVLFSDTDIDGIQLRSLLSSSESRYFSMEIRTTFMAGNPDPLPAQLPAVTQFVFNLAQDFSSTSPPFAVIGCSQNPARSPSTCLGDISISYALDGVRYDGDDAHGRFDLLVDLPPPLRSNGAMLDNSQSPITLLISAPSNFSTADLIKQFSQPPLQKNKRYTAYESLAKVQRLPTAGSTTLIGVDAPPDSQPVPGPLPLLGAASALGFSRALRRRLAVQGSAAMEIP